MIGARIGTLAVLLVTGVLLGAPRVAGAEKPIKQLMGENFGGLQTILYGLISANYGAVPAQADVIRDHASELSGLIPESAQAERETFLAYAHNLGAHAKDIKTIALELSKRDQTRHESSTDYLREALASHYGGMVTMCVACHNRFRPLPVE